MFTFWKWKSRKSGNTAEKYRARPRLEALETRLVPYSASTNAWPAPQLITISFVPDRTVVDSNGTTSTLFADFNARFGSTATWQNLILKAAQQWAQQTNINFAVVPDDGSAFGTGSYQQGARNVGDIRIGGDNFGSITLAQTYMPPPVNNTSYAGDIEINTGQSFNNGGGIGWYDLYTVAMHEIGHSLGLYHSANSAADMYATYTTNKTGLHGDDIAGIQGMYSAGAARSADAYDAAASNNTVATATNISSLVNLTTRTALLSDLNISSTSDVDYYKITLPTGSSGGLELSAQSSGLSLLAPKMTLYDSTGTTVLGTSSATGYTGGTTSITYSSATVGQTYFIKVQGYDSTAFGTGNYALRLSCGPNALPTVTPPNTQLLKGAIPSIGGGQAIKLNPPFQVSASGYVAQTNTVTTQSLAMDASGNYVVVWAAQSQDGSGWGVYAQRYSFLGVAQGSAILVNTTTVGDQMFPAVAMDASGNFVVTWASHGQDGGGWGIFAQRYDALGIAQDSTILVNTTTKGDQTYPSVAMDADGDFVVAWASNGQDGGGWGVYAQRYDALGVAQGSEVLVNTTTKGDQKYPSVAMDADGDFVITWASNGQDGGGWGVYAQRYDALGVAQGSEIRVNTTTKGDRTAPALAMNPVTGDFVITWSSNGQTGKASIYAQRYNAQGMAQGTESQVSANTSGNQLNPSVSMDNSGNFLVSWTSYDAGGKSVGVFGQQFDSTGTAVGTQFALDSSSTTNQHHASLRMDSTGNVVAVWTGTTTGASSIFGQRYLLNGASGLTAMLALDTFFSQTDPRLLGTVDATGTTAFASQENQPNSHSPNCGCGLCQRLGLALGIVNANSEGADLVLPILQTSLTLATPSTD